MIPLPEQSAVALSEVRAQMLDGDKIRNEMKLAHTFQLRNPKKSGLSKEFSIILRRREQPPQNSCSFGPKAGFCVVEEEFSGRRTIGIKKQINQTAQVEAPFF